MLRSYDVANPPPPKMQSTPKKPVAPWRLGVGTVTPWLYLFFVIGGLVQVYLAGYGIQELGAQGMDYHGFFGGAVMHLVPILIALFGFLGADWRAGVGGLVLMVLFEAQLAFLGGTYAPVLALHAFNGVLMTVIALAFVARRQPWRKAVASPPEHPRAKPVAAPRPAAPPVRTPSTPRPPTLPQR